jgi:putative thioredoxin
MLGPILEALAREFQGAFVLAKAETEAMPNIAAAFRIRSIPAVFAIRDGRAIDSFLGALPEAAIRAWLERLRPSPVEEKRTAGRRLERSDPAAAERLFREAIELEPGHADTRIALGHLLLAQGREDEVQAQIAYLERRGFLEPEAEKLKAELNLRQSGEDAGDLAARRADASAHPNDLGLRFKLAEAVAAAGQKAEALALALSIVEEGPKDLRESARKLMLSIFQLLPDDAELANEYRRKLSAALY